MTKIYEIGNFILRNYILETSCGFIAIDTGYPEGQLAFIKKFQKIAPLSELKYIFLTHAHDDHAGFLRSLLNECDAKVILNPVGIPVLEAGENKILPGAGYSNRLAASTFGKAKKEFNFPSVQLGDKAILINSEEEQFFESLGLPLKIVFLPGHTADSIGLYDKSNNILFCGDAAMNAVISLGYHTIWIDDVTQFGQSWDKMIALNPKKIYPSHGNPFSPSKLQKYRHFMDKRKLIPIE
ncbi:MBL fold metallo-hydrolase [Ruminiclostridium herbifermentans]|jgi:glyoxylase-like metal-dependent hydrolase (beta-lactamase superfamily II)|uniref:MBL fold metallo-hydrolase n=1 Tax=Ruminiclostridium herbifermentans TaxID=2488810 RepID=A0A4U7J7Q5_9FIRM|nr:MBL fold metallo-hydrolase [Ruminiclostridium herbifermentans]QNU66488.1 MBL fold metallo-hydrolase [Ruminiclostridium herbifermentans]